MSLRRVISTAMAGFLVLGALTACAASPSAQNARPTPTAACPEQPGVELPPGCAPFDPDQAMAQNDRYRQRLEIDEKTQAAGDALISPVTAALEELRNSGEPVTEPGVWDALAAAGIAAEPQTRSGAGDVLFGVAVESGCLFGFVTPDDVSVEVGGYIMDGGCLPAQ